MRVIVPHDLEPVGPRVPLQPDQVLGRHLVPALPVLPRSIGERHLPPHLAAPRLLDGAEQGADALLGVCALQVADDPVQEADRQGELAHPGRPGSRKAVLR